MNQNYKIIFFGTSEFAVPALKKLSADRSYEIAAVVTQPDMPAGRNKVITPPPVKVEAARVGLKIFQFEVLKIGNWKLEIPPADLFIVASYGNIIPKSILDLPRFGALNIHPTLLPKYRGPSPMQTAILNGETEVGVSVMVLDEKMDHGPILGTAKWQMLTPKVKYQPMHDRLAELGAQLLLDILPKYLSGELKPVPQDDNQATTTKMLTKEDGRIDWTRAAADIDRQIRAYSVWPVAWSMLEGKRFKIFEADARPGLTGTPGMILVDDFKMTVCCGKDILAIYELQLEGARRMTAAEFLRGQPRIDGRQLT